MRWREGKGPAVVLLALVVWIWPVMAGSEGTAFEPLSVATMDGARHDFRVEIADDDEERTRGLMYRRALAQDAGMLFLFPRDQVMSFWMRNTYVPLDMLFIDAGGRIADLHENAWPLDETPIRSDQPVRAVLELVAGSVRRLGIKVGDRIIHRAF